MAKYTGEDLESFVGAIRTASVAIAEQDPRFYIISLHGSLPLFDILQLVDRRVNSDQAIYFPATSRINNSAEILTRCFENFFLERQDETSETRPLASIDEVVSGASVSRVLNAYHSASRRVARGILGNAQRFRDASEEAAGILRAKFPLVVYGIKEERGSNVRMKADYLQKVKSGEVLEFPTKRIITMDDPDYQLVHFDHPNSNGFSGQRYFPTIKDIVLSREYDLLLKDVAMLIGIDPDSLELSRARITSDCMKYSRKPRYK